MGGDGSDRPASGPGDAPRRCLVGRRACVFPDRPPSAVRDELADSHKLRFDAERSALLHIISGPELNRRIQAGVFQTVQICEDGLNVGDLDLKKLYVHQAEVEDCTVFWERAAPGGSR